MSFWTTLGDFILGPLPEQKNMPTTVTTPIPVISSEGVEAALRNANGDPTGDTLFGVSAVFACARVIAEGLALPPCYVHQTSENGVQRAVKHPLHYLLNASPNERQTSYEFREQIGLQLALNSNAYVFINRGSGKQIMELLPIEMGNVGVTVDDSRLGNPVQYTLYGQHVPAANIWHLKGPAFRSSQGMSILNEARNAIGLAKANETYGANLFRNGAKPGALITPAGDKQWTAEQAEQIKAAWMAQSGVANAHKQAVINAPMNYEAMASSANDSQWIESRRYQVEEICRYFRVSPTKVFQSLGSQSYASVEQAHISHDADTDAHWHERFVQSANKALLTDVERRNGFAVTIDNRAALRGTAKERMEYYGLGITNGIFTRNEAREMEGFDKSSDPLADALTPAANLFGPAMPTDSPPAK